MGKKKEKSSKSKTHHIKTTTSSINLLDHDTPKERIHTNHLLIWFNHFITEQTPEYEKIIETLQNVVPDVRFHDDIDRCLDFIEGSDVEVSVLVDGSIADNDIHRIHLLEKVYSIYVYRGNPVRYSAWERKWSKLKGKYDRLETICEHLQHTNKHMNQNATSIVFANYESDEVNENFKQLDPSFMYTTLLKSILFEIEHTEDSMAEFIDYCRRAYEHNRSQLELIDKLHRGYEANQAIRWYTQESFLYQMLNRALRMLEMDIIIMMRVFIQDLHQQIEQLHREQYHPSDRSLLTIYRGQGLSKNQFERWKKNQGGLLSFNSFLSTSKDRSISLAFAENSVRIPDSVGILFNITIDHQIECSTPYANISDLSYFHEDEILFSMHTVFRIGSIRALDESNRLFEVDLTLCNEDDPDMRVMMNRIEEELVDGNPWERLGQLLIKMGQVDQAEKLYGQLLRKSSMAKEKSIYYHHLGVIKDQQRCWDEAIEYYQKALELVENDSDRNELNVAMTLNNIGSCYDSMRSFEKALDHFKRAMDVQRKRLPANHPDLAQTYNNIATVYYHQKKYDPAQFFYQTSLEIKQKTLPACHPSLATTYNNIASIYFDMKKYPEALENFNTALMIREKTQPNHHPDIAQSLSNMGTVHLKMEAYSSALSYHEKALKIQKRIFSNDHTLISHSHKNVGVALMHLRRFNEAFEHFQIAYEIQKDLFPSTHPSLMNLSQWIQQVKKKISHRCHASESDDQLSTIVR